MLLPFLRYADFKGRSGRTEFWTFFGLSVAAFLLAVVVTGLSTDTSTVPQSKTSGAYVSPTGALGYVFWWCVSIVPWFAVQVRRFHDQGRSGWLCLVGAGGYVAVGFGAMPLAAILFLIALGLMALPGKEAENGFGPPVDEVEDFEAAAGELDPIPNCAQLVDVETLAPAFNDTSTTLEMHSDTAERQRELQATEALLTADAALLGGHESAWSASASSVENESEHHDTSSVLLSLPDDVTINDDGRYACRGYVFDSPSAALSYSQRRSAPAPNLRNANSAELDDNRPRRGALDRDHALQVGADTPATVGAMPSYLPDDVKPEGNGRFSCGGYTFNSLEQALSFAKRRNDRGGHLERSVSPFSFVPIPKPPQPSPPKVERSGFLGIGSSAKKQTVAEHWVATPTNLSAGGVPFEGYLVYFGTRPRRQQYERQRSLIDPNLDVSNGRDPQGSTFSYWPNYSELRPEARRSYLDWLSSGRSDPSTPIGYVFIYFYGLERRLVKDRSEADAPAIMS